MAAEDTAGQEQELRLAVVMTGGVSLAVWMGGVALEIDRLRRRHPGVYADLLGLTATRVRVDVISGSSAGGLNGALLATSVAYEDADLTKVREVWLEAGDISKLLRSPFELGAPSLLDGRIFHDNVQEALERVSSVRAGGRLTDPTDNPVHLVVTASLLKGQERGTVDSFGSVICDRDHRARFVFRRGGPGLSPEEEALLDEGERRFDDFASDGLERLALAARASASFPGAFEPTFCPVGEAIDEAPDLGLHASFTESRWAVDGGVLMNKPLEPALDAIAEQSAAEQVRRVLLYVVPDPAEGTEGRPDHLDAPPGLGRVLLGSLSTLPRNESIGEELEEMKARNRRASRRGLDVWGRLDLRATAVALFADYARLRAELVADALLDDLAPEAPLAQAAAGDRVVDAELWRRPVLRRDLVDALQAARASEGSPASFPAHPDQAGQALAWLAEPSAARRAGGVVLDLLRRGLGLGRPAEDQSRGVLVELRRELHRHLRALERLEQPLDTGARSRLAELAVSPSGHFQPGDWGEQALELLGDRLAWGEAGMDAVVGILVRAVPALRVAHDQRRPGQGGEARQLGGLVEQLVPWAWAQASEQTLVVDAAVEERDKPEALLGLLALDVLRVTLGGSEGEQPIELLQIGANSTNGFTQDDEPTAKLAGLQLAHFGAFYKRSWRASDWLWGRLDAAQRLAEVLVEPYRLRQALSNPEEAVSQLEAIALGPAGSAERMVLEDQRWPRPWSRSGMEEELAFLDASDVEGDQDRDEVKADDPLPASLPLCAQFVARRLQLEILQQELPHLARAIRADREAGATTSPAACELAEAIPEHDGVLDPARAAELFLAQHVGQERIAEEVGTDPFARAVSTTGAVGASVLQQAGSGVRPLGPILRFVRGLTLGLHLLVVAALGNGRVAPTLVVATLAAGGALVVVGAFSSGLASAVMLFGIGVLVAGALLTILRRGQPASLGWLIVVAAAVAGLPDLLAVLEVITQAQPYRTVAVSAAILVVGLLLGFLGTRPLRGREAGGTDRGRSGSRRVPGGVAD